MENKFISRDALRKRKARENETPNQRETRLAKQCGSRQQKRAREDAEEREACVARDKERKCVKLAAEMNEQHETRLSYYRERRNYLKNIQNTTDQDLNSQRQQPQQKSQDSGADGADGAEIRVAADALSESDQNLLKKFRDKVDKFKHAVCPTCKESFPSIVLIKGECRRCHSETIFLKNKNLPKKFSADNNMNPGEVPDELQGFTEIEEMLIARIFPVMSVYRLRGGQHGYRGNVINFPQDVQEFATKLPRHPSSLDVLVIRRKSESNPEAFRDFRVRRLKVACALIWLKENNRYYADITIDHEVLRSLPNNDPIDEQLQDIEEEPDFENDEDVITRTFVPYLPPAYHEDVAIKNTLDRVQDNNRPITWPQMNSNPVNEFQTSGYIACAFPSLYPTGNADL
ncbi:12071_t:CDS:1, partial [Rhizophagus irregularis]